MKSYVPKPNEATHWREKPKDLDRNLTLAPVLSGDFFARLIQYPIVVEMWKHLRNGRVRKAYQAEFTEAERKLIAVYHTKFERWHFCEGTPRRVMIRPRTLAAYARRVTARGALFCHDLGLMFHA